MYTLPVVEGLILVATVDEATEKQEDTNNNFGKEVALESSIGRRRPRDSILAPTAASNKGMDNA